MAQVGSGNPLRHKIRRNQASNYVFWMMITKDTNVQFPTSETQIRWCGVDITPKQLIDMKTLGYKGA